MIDSCDTELDGYPPSLRHILNGESFRPMIASSERGTHRERWRNDFRDMIRQSPSEELKERFHTQWHVCHHFVRELVEDDGLLLDLLWVWLPRYTGEDLVLYRGENVDRFEAWSLGSAWTDKQKIAEMFARGLNAVGGGGLLLRAAIPNSIIIAGPTRHSSEWLGENEFTIDTRKLVTVEIIDRFPPST